MPKDPSKRDPLDSMSVEVDRLLKQLPGADPGLTGGAGKSPVAGARPVGLGAGATSAAGPRLPSAQEKAGMWIRVLLGGVLAVVMTQWPYLHACGLPLYLYLGAVITVLVAGGWGGISSWRFRSATAHVASLIVVLWGLVLAAQQVLPRIGYAAVQRSWQCIQQ